MGSGTTTVGSVKYDAVIDLASLKKSVAEGDKIVKKSYDDQAKTAKKASNEVTKTSANDAQARIDAVSREAQENIKTYSNYAPAVQKQFLTVERANNQVTTATLNAQKAIQSYGVDSAQASKATANLSIAVQNQAQQQGKLQTMLENSSTGTNRFGMVMNKAGAIAGAVAGAVSFAAQAVSNYLASVSQDIISASDSLAKYGSTLKFGGFDKSDIDKSKKALKQYADQTVYDMETILNTSAQLAANGVKDFVGLTKAAGNLNAVAGGSANTFKSVALVLTQTVGAGKLITQNWNQIANAIPGASGKLQKALLDAGAYTGNFREAMEKGEISADEFNEAILRLGNMPVAVEAAKSTATFEGALGNLRATIVNLGTTILDSGIGESMISSINGASSAITNSVNWFKKYKDIISQVVTVVGILLIPKIILLTTAMIASGVQALIAGARMAAAWLLALGPIGLIIAAVAAAAALIIANWDSISAFVADVWQGIKSAIGNVIDWVRANWPLMFAIITGPLGLAAYAIIKNFDTIKAAVGNVWDWIKGVFGTIGSVAASIIKTPVNAIISYAEFTLNGFIKAINGAIGSINRIPGVGINMLSPINIPKLAEGGIVPARRGGILANIAEGGEDEAVMPLSKLEKLINGTTNNHNITVNLSLSGIMTSSKSDERAIATRIAKLINETVKAKTGNTAFEGM